MRNFCNERKLDRAMMCRGRRFTGCEFLFPEKKQRSYPGNEHRLTLCQQYASFIWNFTRSQAPNTLQENVSLQSNLTHLTLIYLLSSPTRSSFIYFLLSSTPMALQKIIDVGNHQLSQLDPPHATLSTRRLLHLPPPRTSRQEHNRLTTFLLQSLQHCCAFKAQMLLF